MEGTNGAVKPVEMENLSNGMMNGISNGSPHKEHKHKHKDKERDRDRHKSSHKDKDRDRSRDHHSSHKSSHKEKDRDKDRHKDKHKESRDKDKDRHRSKDDKHRSRNDKHKDRSKDADRHKDKDKRSSSSGEKRDRDKDRHHSHKSSHKDRHRDSSSSAVVKHESVTEDSMVKQEHTLNESHSSDDFKPTKEERFSIKEEMEVESEEEFKPFIQGHTVLKEEMLESEEEYEHELVIKEESYAPPEDEEEDDDDEDDIPLASRKRQRVKMEEESDEDDVPLIARKKVKIEKKVLDEDFKQKKSKTKRKLPKETVSPTKKKKKQEEENVWKWWEEEKKDDGVKWKFLEHKGPVFADPYQRVPSNVKFYYKGEHIKLCELAEEVAGFYARMIDHEYTTKDVFNNNFFKDWRKTMTSEERSKIVDLKKCDFRKLHEYYLLKAEERKNRTKEEKKELKETNEQLVAEYGWCMIDKHKQRIGNFKIEPPGLFRGRGEHPKMGMLKRRLLPEDVIINCSKDSVIPKPPNGRRWKEIRHDSAVTWLCSWTENIQNQTKYVMLNAASKLKGEKDWQKYETARRLHKIVDRIREKYKAEFKSKEMRVRQRAVALYFIDKLALRAGNEKDEDQADTVGCCSLRVEHITLTEEKDDKEFVVAFDFLGKDSIRYYNEVPVEKRVFKNLQLFMENKQGGDDLFDRLNTQIMNKHLTELMDGLTAKVFRTYNASRTLQEQLEKLTDEDDNCPQKILSYNRANREVAILCNHQRAVPKTFDKSMANLQKKIDDKKAQLQEEERHLRDAKKAAKHGGSVKDKMQFDKKRKAVERVKDQLYKLEISATDKEENKQIALGTSKLNYLDPRISVAWCKKHEVPIEKVYNKTQRQKFQWAIDMATAEYNFMGEPMNITKSQEESDDDPGEDDE